MIELIIFDVDGTLAEAFTLDLLPNVESFFRLVFQARCPDRPKVAIATNQGGVGMRHWMERAGFGKPGKFPTQEEIESRLENLLGALGGDSSVPVYVSYRFQTSTGKWTPVPEGERSNPRWSSEWRKPQPGMLLQAMADAGVSPGETMFVGDSDDDQAAAEAAGCKFMWAKDFFNRSWENCEELSRLHQ